MKFFFDHNTPPNFAHALAVLSQRQGVQQVIPLRDKFDIKTQDHEWMSTLSGEGGWCVITHDRFTKGQFEKQAFAEAELITFILSGWCKHQFWDQAHSIVKHWPLILKVATKARPGDVFKVPYRISGGKYDKI